MTSTQALKKLFDSDSYKIKFGLSKENEPLIIIDDGQGQTIFTWEKCLQAIKRLEKIKFKDVDDFYSSVYCLCFA
jgi:hypothetical protein